MVKSLLAVLLFVKYCLLNIYEGILTSAPPMAAHCQHVCRPCPFNFTVLLHIKLFSQINTNVACQENIAKARTLSMVCHLDAHIITIRITFCNKTC